MRRLLVLMCVGGTLGCEQAPAPVQADRPTVALGVRVLTENIPPIEGWELQAWVMTLSAVELHLCEEVAWSFVPSAWAHVPSSSTRLGTPVVEDLTRGSGGARIIGEISPPPGRYCKAYAVFSPADDDVLNMTPLSTSMVEGATSLRVLRKPDQEPLVQRWEGKKVVEVLLNGENGPGMNLSWGQHGQIVFEIPVNPPQNKVDEAAESGDNPPSLEPWVEHVLMQVKLFES
ncbi:hypothetical protein FRD01_19650 [Microvenator marinus]|uniref:Uncharacterized protein n=1 Tax=Microvenator marinus TaxID=2600177 RepID=A0A5B8XWR2_9DELT|nr:hypothetical protein [Microvenator marinus]QED29408.1 hypothetical protein FRD01_19650 [Microvenator marinus]